MLYFAGAMLKFGYVRKYFEKGVAPFGGGVIWGVVFGILLVFGVKG